jgi:hypothetical protein
MTFPAYYFRRATAVASILALCTVMTPASATPSDALDALSISIGDYIVSPDANLSVNSPYGSANSGTVSSHQVQVPHVKADFLLGDSQGFALDYYGFYRQYADSFNRSFSAGPSDVTISGNVNGNVNIDLANASYKWWFGEGSDVVGIGIGAAYYRIHFGVDGNAASNVNNSSGSSNASYSTDAVAPLLQLGWRHAFSANTRMYVDLSGVEKSGGNLTGHIYNAAIGAEWYFARHFGVGAEYSATRVQVNMDGGNGQLDLRLDGPTIFMKARF